MKGIKIMRKLSKALVLILSLVLIVTAFAVVSFAAEENTLKPLSYNSPSWSWKNNGFEGVENGNYIYYSADRYGQVTAVKQDNGNTYALMEYRKADGTTSQGMWDFAATYDTACNIENYPYFMVEFDIMTQNGSYDKTSVYTRLYSGGTSINFVSQTHFTDIGLSTVPYDWNHVSIIVKYNGDATFTQYAFVNGKLAKTNPIKSFAEDSKWKALDGNYSTTRVRDFRFYPDSTADTPSQVGLDNFSFTYFPTDYLDNDLTAIANYKYKNGNGYEFPYRKTAATLTDNETGEVTYYDDLNKALADKNDTNTFELLCDAEVIHPSGVSDYITADEFAAKFTAAPSGSTIKLHNDITLTSSLSFSYEQKLTLDLNGYNIYRMGTNYTDYAAVLNEETGEYEKGDALESPAAVAGGTMFNAAQKAINFTVTSSRPGGALYSVSTTAERLLLGGKVVSTNVTATSSSNIFSVASANITILLKDIETYANSVVYAEHGGCSNFSFNIDGGTHVKILDPKSGTTGMFHLLRGGNHTIKNATIVGNTGYAVRLYGYNTYATVTYENCNIAEAHNQADVGETIIFKNCRVYSNFGTISGTVHFEGPNRFNNKYDEFTYTDGVEVISQDKTYTYTYATKLAFDPITLLPYLSNTQERTSTLKYLAYNPATDVASVTWVDLDGKVITTEPLIKGEKAVAPIVKLESADGWRSPIVTEWTDEEGNKSDLIIGNANAQTYTAVAPVIDENTKYVADISNAMLSFSYVAQFHMYLYLPIEEGMDKPVIKGTYHTNNDPSASSGKVLINRQEYYVYTWWCDAASVATGMNITVTFTIDGVEYKQNISINALMYAEIVLSNPTSDKEALAVANMVRYVKEAVIARGQTPSDKFDELIGSEGLYPNLPAYEESYPDDSLDLAAIEKYIEKFNLRITGTPCFQLTLSKEAIALKMTKDNFKLKAKDGTVLDLFDYAKNGKDYETNNTKIYDLIKTFTITVTVPAVKDAETGEVITESFQVSADYSIGTYIKGAQAQNPDANLDLAKAAYAFGVAALDYRRSVLDY